MQEFAVWEALHRQVRDAANEQERQLRQGQEPHLEKVRRLMGLKAVGVLAEIQVIEWASFIKEFIKKKRFEAVVLGWGVGTDPDQYPVWHSSQTGLGLELIE